MIKKFKKFNENSILDISGSMSAQDSSYLEYAKSAEVGDILICVDDDAFYSDTKLVKGDKYKILFIHKPKDTDIKKFYYFDVENITTGKISIGTGARLFKSDYYDDVEKYNL